MGKEFVRQLDEGLYTVEEFWLIARRKERMEEMASRMNHPARILPLDLEQPESFEQLKKLLSEEKPVIRMLINSAGYGLMGSFAASNEMDQAGMIDLNCRALTEITRLCIPWMKRGSRIIQLASSAGFLPQPGFAVYAASKSYVLSFSRALREELKDAGIHVTAVCPGPVRTEFFERAEKNGSTLALKKYVMTEAERVVTDALKASARRQSISVCTPVIKLFHLITRLLPHSLILSVMRFLKHTESKA